MKRFRSSITVATLMASAILPLVITAASAQAALDQASPDFTCPDRTVCIFQGGNFNDYAFPFGTVAYGESWISLTQYGFTLPWGSINNNSGSSVLIENQAGDTDCFYPNARENASEIDAGSYPPGSTWPRYARYMFIEYGNTTCTGSHPPVP